MGLTSVSEILEARRFLQGKYSTRDNAYSKLRALYNADYFSGKSHIQGVKLVYNLLANVVDRYTDFMSQPPDWRVIPFDVTPDATIMADKQEKFLYGQWDLNNILTIQQWQAHLQALLGSFGFSIHPNFDASGKLARPEKYVKINVLTPDYVYPMPKSDNIRDLEFVIVDGYDYMTAREQYNPNLRPGTKRDFTNEHIYYDEEKIIFIKDNKIKNEIVHNFGFIPVVIGQNRVKPHYVEGVGDLDQSVGLAEFMNELLSWQAEIAEYEAAPTTIVKGWSSDQKFIKGGTNFMGPEGDAKFLTWPGNAPSFENLLTRVIGFIQDQTHLSPAILGKDIPSGTSGSAVQSLLSGIQATMLRKQITLGDVYAQTNEIIFRIVEKIFGNQEIVVRGTRRGNVFVEKFMGKDINGNYRNQVIWPPGILDQPSRVNLEVVKLQNGLQSRYTTMEKIGIDSPVDEVRRIEAEQIQAIQRQQALEQGNSPLNKDFATMANALAKDQELTPQGGNGSTELVQVIKSIPKLKGDVFFAGRTGDKLSVVLTDMTDKATIVNRLPPGLKGRLVFRKYNESTDSDLQPIVEQEAPSAA